MAGLEPAIHVMTFGPFLSGNARLHGVDARDKRGHDGMSHRSK
jgi:hypothetical protein